MRKKLLPALIIAVLILISACSSNHNKLVIGLIKPSLDHLPFDFGLLSGDLFKDDYQVKYFSSGWATNEALVAGKVDVAILPFTYVWSDAAAGKNVRIISFLERESDGIVASKKIKSIKDLDGKKIGVLRASTLDIFMEMTAAKKGFKYTPVYFRTPMEMAAALQSGNVDALSYYVPSIFKFDQEKFHIIYWYSEDFPLHPCCDLAANMNIIQEKKDKIIALEKGLLKSCGHINEAPQLTYEVTQHVFNLTPEEARQSNYHTKFVMNATKKYKNFERQAALIMQKKGYLKKVVAPENVYYEIE